jgi:hypothetical protein
MKIVSESWSRSHSLSVFPPESASLLPFLRLTCRNKSWNSLVEDRLCIFELSSKFPKQLDARLIYFPIFSASVPPRLITFLPSHCHPHQTEIRLLGEKSPFPVTITTVTVTYFWTHGRESFSGSK